MGNIRGGQEGPVNGKEGGNEMIKAFWDGIISLIQALEIILTNDKVLIPFLVTLIIMYSMYLFGLDAKEITLTGLGYLAGATQGSRKRATDNQTNGGKTP